MKLIVLAMSLFSEVAFAKIEKGSCYSSQMFKYGSKNQPEPQEFQLQKQTIQFTRTSHNEGDREV
ncbi:MAG: hypothetical protein GW917_03665, partial [Bdellovibrionales bacterium]|nr:hypothetical protein [Bdellovibrionales bacterium]